MKCRTCGGDRLACEPDPFCFTCAAVIRAIARGYERALEQLEQLRRGGDS